ncbi:MAG TPA: carboxypeptidase regulatory-like domain-containing protein [Actinoplanes sp.]|nr:carboxypeptidase regulatory-like domain-containing protein [Actinoplanes sp.]
MTSVLSRAGVPALAVLLAAGGFAPPAHAADRGTIQGTYLTDAGAPIAGAMVVASDRDGTWLRDTTTDDGGRYTLRNVDAGEVTLEFQNAADPVTVTAGDTTRVGDRFLATGSLGGRLTGSDGEPLQVGVSLRRGEDTVGTTYTDDNGDYGFANVLPGEYAVSFYTWNDGVGLEQYLYGTVLREQAHTFTVTAGEHTVANDSRPRPGTVQGRLTDPAGAPVAGRRVSVVLDSETDVLSYDATTEADGIWRIDGVFPARYRVSFTDVDSGRTQYAYGKGTAAAADRIEVTSGGTATVDDTWLPGATLVVRGVDSVTGAAATNFCVYVAAIEAGGCTTGSEVALSDLAAAGNVSVDTSQGRGSFYLSSDAHPVTLTAGVTTTVTIPLVRGGKSSATVTAAATGEPVARTCVQLRRLRRGGLGDSYGACTNASGVVTTEAVEPGTYTVFAHAPDAYGHQWVGPAGGTGDQRAAAKVTIRAGKVTKAPAVRLDRPGTVTGVVTGPDGQLLADVDVAYTAWGYGVGPGDTVTTGVDGRYALSGLGPYSWPLVFTHHDYARVWSGGTGNRYQAETIAVPPGDSARYDIALTRGTLLKGTVTAPAGTESWRLTAVNAATGDAIGVADFTTPDHTYEMPLAGAQQVKIHWSVSGSDFWRDGWWPGAADQDSATKVRVPVTGSKKLNLTIG